MKKDSGNKCKHTVAYDELNQDDLSLVKAAIEVLKANFHPIKHQVGCALRTVSGKVYKAVNIEASIYSQCAEVIAIGTAVSNGERDIASIVAVKKVDDNFPVISPCGNCRQLILDYAHNASIILCLDGVPAKMKAVDLLPGAYENSFTGVARSHSLD